MNTPPRIDVRPLGDQSDEETLCGIAAQTFNFPTRRWDSFVANVGRQNLRVICQAGQVRGGAACYRLGQWFGGRTVPMGGIALVAVAPEFRGTGLAFHLLKHQLQELADQGVPLATLYASTQALYRKLGFEQAGTACRHRLPVSCLGATIAPLPLRRVPAARHELFRDLDERRARLSNGCLQRNPGIWRRVTHADEEVFAYLVGEPGRESGYMIYTQQQERPARNHLLVRDLVALSAEAVHSIWSFFGGHRTIFATVSWNGPTVDPLLLAPVELQAEVVEQHRWMTRIVDARAALAARGYPAGASGQLHLEITDDLLPANNGRLLLRVNDGAAEVVPGGEGTLRTTIRGLVPLYTGLFSAHQLARFGWIEAADSQVLDTADRLLHGTEPWMADKF